MSQKSVRDHFVDYYSQKSLSPEAEERLTALAMAGPGGADPAPRWPRRIVLAGVWAASLVIACGLAYTAGSAGLLSPGRGDQPAWGPGASQAVSPDLVAVRVHADWCNRSPEITPIFSELTHKYGNHAVLFVTLDITDETTRRQAELLAENLGLEELTSRPQESGTVTLFDRAEGRALATFTGGAEAMRLDRLLARSLHLEESPLSPVGSS